MSEVAANLVVRSLGTVDYLTAWRRMRAFTEARTVDTPDELWVLQHHPVFTLGYAGSAEHLIAVDDIPVVDVDRGGQVTYHGPGQLVIYTLIDIRRKKIGVRQFVSRIEQSLIEALMLMGISAHARDDAPGVYLENDAKIAQLGLRVRKGRSYHGLAWNIDMDLSPFFQINPCGYAGALVTDVATVLQSHQNVRVPSVAEAADLLIKAFQERCAYTNVEFFEKWSEEMVLSSTNG